MLASPASKQRVALLLIFKHAPGPRPKCGDGRGLLGPASHQSERSPMWQVSEKSAVVSRCEGVAVCWAECVLGLQGPDAHSVWTRCFQSLPSTENVEHGGEKATTSSARGGTAASGWKRALSVVFWWSPSPPEMLRHWYSNQEGNTNTGRPEDPNTRQRVNHDGTPCCCCAVPDRLVVKLNYEPFAVWKGTTL